MRIISLLYLHNLSFSVLISAPVSGVIIIISMVQLRQSRLPRELFLHHFESVFAHPPTASLPMRSPLALVSLVYSPYTKYYDHSPVEEPHDFPRQSGAHRRRLDENTETTSSLKCIAPGAGPLPAGKGRRDEELAVSFISLVGLF